MFNQLGCDLNSRDRRLSLPFSLYDLYGLLAGSGCAQRCRLNIGLTAAQEAEVRAVPAVVKPMVL